MRRLPHRDREPADRHDRTRRRGQGAADQAVTVTGDGFQPGATVKVSGSGVQVNTTTWISANTIALDLTVTASASVGARNVTVTNPDTGLATCTGCFTVNPKPGVTGVSPSALRAAPPTRPSRSPAPGSLRARR